MSLSFWPLIRDPLFRIDGKEVTFRRRGFEVSSPVAQTHLEQVGTSFLLGYHLAIDSRDMTELSETLSACDAEYQGFSYEGAAMGLGLLDALSLGNKRRWQRFLDGPANSHRYVVHVGLGWVVARLPWLRSRPERAIAKLDPLLKWLVLDGYGFHEGYFHWKKWSPETKRRPPFSGYASRAFDQGLGRCLWFVSGGDVHRAVSFITAFDADRHSDLWSGLGLACAYAGKPTELELNFLMERAGEYLLHFRQGITFGAEARELAGISTEHTEQTCRIACGMSAAEAARITYAAIPSQFGVSHEAPAYEIWRSQIREILGEEIPSCL